MTVKEFVSALRSYLEQRESLKKQLQQVCNLKNQISYSDLSSLDMKQSVSSARLQAKVYEDIEIATEKFKSIQEELVQKTYELTEKLCALQDEDNSLIDIGCAKKICHGIQQQSLLELCLTEKLCTCTSSQDNDVLVTITQCFAQEIYMNPSDINDILSVHI